MNTKLSAARMRPFAPYDLPGIYRVCGEVDARGGAKRQQLRAPDLPGHIFAGPYLVSDPDLSWVVADDQGVAGYLVATADAVQFERWREEHWFPPIRDQHSPSAFGRDSPDDDRYLAILHAPPREATAFPSAYPAELHIKLDPRVARQGWGMKLINELLAALRERRVSGLHLSVSIENAGAVAFYSRVGFVPFEQSDRNLTMTKLVA
jgi:ribosomal protein S18 acetylase RimI-like enzyme